MPEEPFVSNVFDTDEFAKSSWGLIILISLSVFEALSSLTYFVDFLLGDSVHVVEHIFVSHDVSLFQCFAVLFFNMKGHVALFLGNVAAVGTSERSQACLKTEIT